MKNFSSFTVTVPNDGSTHELLTLMRAVDKDCAQRTKYLTLQNDQSSGGTLLIGEAPTTDLGASNPAALTSTNFGQSLAQGIYENFGGTWDEDFSLARFWLMASGGSVTLRVMALRG